MSSARHGEAVEWRVLKAMQAPSDHGVVLFAIVRNEMYFLPRLLDHYRALGIREFCFVDDQSDDGSRQYLMAQADCAVLEANRRFGDRVGRLRFAEAVKTLVPRARFQDRWVLIVDADEFLVLPPGIASVGELTARMDRHGVRAARALMLDFFPQSLDLLEQAPADADPFDICPWFDALSQVDWPDGASAPRRMSQGECVRPRMMRKLLDDGVDLQPWISSYSAARINKVPLIRWGPRTHMASAHDTNVRTTDRVQLVLAHFKFFPGHRTRIDAARSGGGYWRNSIEYRFLDVAVRHLERWPLPGARSRRFMQPQDLADAGLLHCRLQSAGDAA